MVEENSSKTQQASTTQSAPEVPTGASDKPTETGTPYSAGKQTLIVVLIFLGVVIGVPFLLFMTCLGIMSINGL